ncbi:MAG: HAD family hydrolase [Deltaproteobacteria bacterium]|nr:HAD family hydrolase [Deltaproteobacteria bacterium]
MSKIGVFLDRDDTVIKDKVYLRDPGEVEILPGVPGAIKQLNNKVIPVIIVSNQSGIARGYLDEERLAQIHDRLLSTLARQGATIDGVYYCPHHPEGVVEAYSRECECRKPSPGMLYKAARDFGLDLGKCYMVGDKSIDVETIHRVGGKGIIIGKGNSYSIITEYIAKDLMDAVRWILKDIDPSKAD